MGFEARFDESTQAPTRLRLCAMLRPVDFVEFFTLTSALGVGEANLSKTIRKLVALGDLSTWKHSSPDRNDFRRRTKRFPHQQARRGFDHHLAVLQGIATQQIPARTPPHRQTKVTCRTRVYCAVAALTS